MHLPFIQKRCVSLLCMSAVCNLLLLGLGAGLGKCMQVEASGIVSMYGWMDVWRRAILEYEAYELIPKHPGDA